MNKASGTDLVLSFETLAGSSDLLSVSTGKALSPLNAFSSAALNGLDLLSVGGASVMVVLILCWY